MNSNNNIRDEKHRFPLIPLTLSIFLLGACGEDFSPFTSVDRLRILGARVDSPEICIFGPDECPEGTFKEKVNVSLLAADENGIVADGDWMPDGNPYLRNGYEMKWAMCAISFAGAAVQDPDCTHTDDGELILQSQTSFTPVTLNDIVTGLMKSFEGLDVQEPEAEGSAGEGEEFKFDQSVGVAISGGQEREWGLVAITLSGAEGEEINENPLLEEVTLEGVVVEKGQEPFAEVETGYAYKVEWKFDDDLWEYYTAETIDGIRQQRELLNLGLYATAGSFNKGGPVNIWLQDEDENEVYWRPPLEVPEEGLEVTLIFNLYDYRGGAHWTWGKVKVVRGEAVSPR